MGEQTAISWTDRTQNFWIGCTRVSPGCDHCYAADLAERYGWAQWGAKQPRHRTSSANWRKPVQWERQAVATGRRLRVFCSSLADFFDAEVPEVWRQEAWAIIRATPHLDWQLLTKRPNLIRRYLPDDWDDGWPNVWLGTTVESQAQTWRILPLLRVKAAVRFLSCEPLLGPLDLSAVDYLASMRTTMGTMVGAEGVATVTGPCSMSVLSGDWDDGWDSGTDGPRVDWVIAGGESGPQHREMDWGWARALRDQCVAAGTAFFWKQGAHRSPGHYTTLDGVEWHQFPTVREAAHA
jgi:protein gp37